MTEHKGTENDPIPVQKEHPFSEGTGLVFGDRPYLWVVTPSDQRVKCYRSYEDYCDD